MPGIKKLIIASRNSAKVDYYRHLFTGIVGNIIGLCDTKIVGKPVEVGETAENNAEIKARFYSAQTDFPVFCEDEALYVDFLPNNRQPGTHVRRINGKDEVTDGELLAYWEGLIRTVPENKRTGRWHIAYCLALNDQTKIVSMDHEILFFYPASKIRIPGWPMSSLEGSAKLRKPNSERTEVEKQEAISAESPIILKELLKLF